MFGEVNLVNGWDYSFLFIITRAERHRVLKWAPFVFRIIFFIFFIFIFFRVDFRSFADTFEFFEFFHALFNGGFDCRPS